MIKITGTIKQFKSMFEKMMCGTKYPLFTDINVKIDNGIIYASCVDTTRAVGTNQEYSGFEIVGDGIIPLNMISIYEAINLFNDNDNLIFEYDTKIKLTVNSDSVTDIIEIPVYMESNNNSEIIIKKINDMTYTINDNELKFIASGIIDTKYIKQQIKKANYINANYHEYNIEIDKGEINISVGDIVQCSNSSTKTTIQTHTTGSAKSMFCYGYDDIFKTLIGEVSIMINNNKPMVVSCDADDYKVTYLIAPIVPK